MEQSLVIGLLIGTALLSAWITGMLVARNMRHKVTYMLDALEDQETHFKFNEHKVCYRRYNRTLNRIRRLFEHEKEEIRSQEHFYGQILERVDTAIVVTDCSPRREGKVIYHNPKALRLLGIATFSHLRQLTLIDETLAQKFCHIGDNREEHCSFYNERGKTTLALTAINTCLQNQPVKIFMFNNVTDEMQQQEGDSWNKLIRVLTHEIMNTMTPIASLTRSLSDEMNTKSTAHIDPEELKNGLETIHQSAEGLIQFVHNYRKLTRVATPRKSAFFVRELISQTEQLTAEQCHAAGVTWEYTEKSDDILLYADLHQIVQIMINLVRNAIQAGASRLQITAEIDFAESVIIRISNNGHPIDSANQEEIFIPFYTTKPEGTGIGLSLSRQIMRLHNGTLDLERSDENGTVFRLIFK